MNGMNEEIPKRANHRYASYSKWDENVLCMHIKCDLNVISTDSTNEGAIGKGLMVHTTLHWPPANCNLPTNENNTSETRNLHCIYIRTRLPIHGQRISKIIFIIIILPVCTYAAYTVTCTHTNKQINS